ncbi:hypothetical protein [Jiangella rhizosphaerae]|uniref:hypothetical protein n=1 Tax=Jiangella rhizosphaerae TaxID=2293569 RepID=UPI0013142707|nr:hypothetical protein [Jiangella rhizosphaerae]
MSTGMRWLVGIVVAAAIVALVAYARNPAKAGRSLDDAGVVAVGPAATAAP